jgi:hypothetical protein
MKSKTSQKHTIFISRSKRAKDHVQWISSIGNSKDLLRKPENEITTEKTFAHTMIMESPTLEILYNETPTRQSNNW